MAANYEQPPAVEKRVRFFDGQYLQDQDFIDEQKYHVDRHRRHNRTLHIAGIADGLVVAKAAGAAARVTVATGTAVDADGRQLVLAKTETVDLPGSQLANRTANLYLVYREQPADLQTQAGSKDYSRWQEQPEIRAVAKGEAVQGDYPPVLLAELALDGSGNITSVNPNVRQYSGLRLPGPNADGPTLRTDPNGLVRLEGGLTVTGNVGIGTASPQAKLHVAGAMKIDSSNTLEFGAGVSGKEGNAGKIGYQTFTPDALDIIGAGAAGGSRKIKFWAEGGAILAGGLTVGGSVGIGTTAITQQLTVNGRVYIENGVIQRGGDAITGTSDLGLYSQVDGQWIRFVTKNAPIRFFTDGGIGATARLSIDQAGNVGIGTTSPGAKLSFPNTTDSDAGTAGITWFNPNPTGYGIHRTDGAWIAPNYQQLRLAWDTGIVLYPGAAYGKSYVDIQGGGLRVTAGSVGIGTTAITQQLTVNGRVYIENGVIQRGGDAITGTSDLGLYSQVDGHWIRFVTKNGPIRFFTDGGIGTTARLSIDQAGSVGIGTASPEAKLHVAGAMKIDGSNTLELGAGVGGKESSAGKIGYQTWTTDALDIVGAGTNGGNRKIKFWAEGGATLAGGLTVSGNVGIGATNLGGRLTVGASGTQLQLRRESTETSGGKQLFLELFQDDSNPPKVPEVYPSIRFHHAYRFWHRLEARPDGFHLKVGNPGSDDYVPLTVGGLQVNGKFSVGGGQTVTGIPVIEFRSQQQRFSDHRGSAKILTYSFTFSRPVVSAESMLKSWFLRYANRENVKEAGVGCYATRISGNTVAVDVYFFLRDASGNYDDPYEGEAIVVVIAQLSQAV